jgi:hypothetical protein
VIAHINFSLHVQAGEMEPDKKGKDLILKKMDSLKDNYATLTRA